MRCLHSVDARSSRYTGAIAMEKNRKLWVFIGRLVVASGIACSVSSMIDHPSSLYYGVTLTAGLIALAYIQD
jgi:hypothetical protein